MSDLSLVHVENVKQKGVDMVSIKIGNELVMLTTGEARVLGTVITNSADLPGQLAHIDRVFDGWGDDGGTC